MYVLELLSIPLRPAPAVVVQLMALTEITGVKGARARLLYKAGLRTPEAVAATDLDRWVRLVVAFSRLPVLRQLIKSVAVSFWR